MTTTFDDFGSDDQLDYHKQPPYEFAGLKKKEDILKWLKTDYDNKKQAAESRFRHYRENRALYKGIHYRSMETRGQDFRRDAGDRNIRSPKVVVNHVQEMVEAKVARRSRFKPSFTMMPNNSEWSDKVNTRAAEMLVKNRFEEVRIDNIFAEFDRQTFVDGEAYVLVDWDKELGPKLPAGQELMDKGEKIPKLDKDGEPTGKFIDVVPNVGDVDYRVYGMDQVFLQNQKTRWDDVKEMTTIEWIHTNEAKARWPEHADEINSSDEQMWDPEEMQLKKMADHIVVATFWHKKTKFLPEGRKTLFTVDVILEDGPLPFDHGELPFIRQTDIDVPGELFGRSFIMNIRQLQRHFNNLASGVARNHGIASAPKWMMPKGSCSIKSLNNDLTVVEYSGPQPPILMQSSPTSPEIFDYMDRLERLIEKQSTIYGISRGEPPKGVKAAVALQFLDEQELERESRGIAKRYQAIKDMVRLTAATMGQYYTDGDNRTVRILGKDNAYMIKSLKQADFSRFYDVRIHNSSSLPDSKAARIQAIIDLNISSQTDPIFRREHVIDMLDLASINEYKDRATVAVKAAESVVASILDGEEDVPEPREYDDLLVHYDIYMVKLQERSFKEEVPNETQNAFIQRIKICESIMYRKAMKNMKFAMKLAELDDFPVFYTPGMEEKQALMAAIMPQTEGMPSQDISQVNPVNLAGPPTGVDNNTQGENV